MSEFLRIWNSLPQKRVQNNTAKRTYQAQFGEYDYSTATTHDWSKVKNFSSELFTMQSAGNRPKNIDYNKYNGFYTKLSNPDFDMPVAKLNLIG